MSFTTPITDREQQLIAAAQQVRRMRESWAKEKGGAV